MYKALLWKEWRETRLLIFIMALGAPCFSILLNILEDDGEIISAANLILYGLILVFYSVLIAAVQFAGDEESGTSSFLISRPVHWFKIWLLKVTYGLTTLILVTLFLYIMGNIFILPAADSDSLILMILMFFPEVTPFINVNGVLFCLTVLTLYFISCAVSTIIKSSLKSVLATGIVSLFIFFLMLYSISAIYFKELHYIIFIIFPVLFFIFFVKYRPVSTHTKTAYWALSIGIILLWTLTALKGLSLLPLLLINNIQSNYFIGAYRIFWIYVIPACFFASVTVSIFASGIFRKLLPAWWKSLSCLNFFITTAFCISAFLVFITPGSKNIDFAFHRYELDPDDRDNSNATFVINTSLNINRKASLRNKAMWTSIGLSEKHFMLDRDKAKVTFFAKGKFSSGKLLNISPDQRWVMYICPTLKWGLYYTPALWAENLETSEQFQLMALDSAGSRKGWWFDNGRRFIFKDTAITDKMNIFLFSVEKGTPELLKKIEASQDDSLLQIDKRGRLYFFNFGSRLVTCYNSNLEKEYETDIIREKVNDLKSELTDKNTLYSSGYPVISPDGKYMFFNTWGSVFETDRKNRKQLKKRINHGWHVLLEDSRCREIGDLSFHKDVYNFKNIQWHPTADNLWAYNHTAQEDRLETVLFDMESGTTKTVATSKSLLFPFMKSFFWSGNGNYFLTCTGNSTISNEMTVNLYSFNLKAGTSEPVSSKKNLIRYSQVFSPSHSHAVFRSKTYKDLWVLDFNTGKWTEITPSFKNYSVIGISNKGDVFLSTRDKPQIYRVAQDKEEVIFPVK